jgi:hypothetical protein
MSDRGELVAPFDCGWGRAQDERGFEEPVRVYEVKWNE